VPSHVRMRGFKGQILEIQANTGFPVDLGRFPGPSGIAGLGILRDLR
jgi:hypothetical protein